jgi:hypothetical protein
LIAERYASLTGVKQAVADTYPAGFDDARGNTAVAAHGVISADA